MSDPTHDEPQEITDEETPPVFRQALDYAKQRLVKVAADRDTARRELAEARSKAQVDVTRLEEKLAEIRSDLYVAIGVAEIPDDLEALDPALRPGSAAFDDGFLNGLRHALEIVDRIDPAPAPAPLPDDPHA